VKSEAELHGLDLTRFLHANRYPSSGQAQGHVSLEKRSGAGEAAMADRTGLKIVGIIFATVTLAVTLATWTVVKGYADGVYSLENSAPARMAVR
jgi:hypothetical protein